MPTIRRNAATEAFRHNAQGGTLGMKTSQQIIGLPVVSISDGNEIGKVKNVMINAVKGTVDFFVIDSAMRSLAGGVVPVGKVLGIGADALTILEADDVSDIVKIPAAIDLLQKNITVRGTRVLTRKGSLLGEVGDVFVNEDESCAIIGVEFVPGNSKVTAGIIPRNSIITFGKNLLVVEEGFTENLLPMSVHEADAAIAATVAEPMAKADLAQSEPETVPHPTAMADAAVEAEAVSEPEISLDGLFGGQSEDDANAMLADRRIQYLRGRRLTQTILGPDGELVANAGSVIDDALMERARQAGRLVELVMNNEA